MRSSFSSQRMSIKEVAKLAGVSTATVSRVMHGRPEVRSDYVAAVQAAVKQLDYTPLRVHRKRKMPAKPQPTTATGQIAVVAIGHERSWLKRPALAQVLSGVRRGIAGQGLRMVVDEMFDANSVCPSIAQAQVDGAIVFVSSLIPMTEAVQTLQCLRSHMPLVWVMGVGMDAGIDHVAEDNVRIGQIAYSHLRSHGCERLAFLTTNPRWPLMRQRGQTFLNSAADDGQAAQAFVVAQQPSDGSVYGGDTVAQPTLEALVRKMAKMASRPDGIFLGNDAIACQVYPLLERFGLRIGRDVKLVSCDNEQSRIGDLQPPLPSIDIGCEEIGYRAAHRLLNRIHRQLGAPLSLHIAPKLQAPVAAIDTASHIRSLAS